MRLEQDNLQHRSKGKPDDKPSVHSDQVWHHQMQPYQQTLKDNSIIQSMSDAVTAWIMQ